MRHLRSLVFLLLFFFLINPSAILILPATAQPANPDVPEGYELVGDMILPVNLSRFNYRAKLWTNGIVPYVFDSGVLQINHHRMLAAMNEWESTSGVRFVPRTGQPNYILIRNGSGNASSADVGMRGGEQYVNIAIGGWLSKYTITHELGHTLGMWHEQQRPDRDQFVQIHYENIQPGYASAFDIIPNLKIGSPYDFISVMHYNQVAFSQNGEITIEALSPYTEYQDLMGDINQLSDADRAGMLTLYPGTPLGWGDTRDFAITTNDYSYETFNIHLNTDNATVDLDDPQPGCTGANTINSTVWFTIDVAYYNASQPEYFTLAVDVQGYDALIGVYLDTLTGLEEVDCINQADGANPQQLKSAVRNGRRYYVMVAGVNGAKGNLNFDANVLYPYTNPASAPTSDDFDNAVNIPRPAYASLVDTASATLGSDDPVGSCVVNPQFMSNTIWYKFTPSTSGQVKLQAKSLFAALISVWTGTRGSLVEAGCSSSGADGLTMNITGGTPYYILISGDSAGGQLLFTADFAAPDLLINGDLEDTNADKIPDDWTIKNPTKDKSKCSDQDANAPGQCAFAMTATPGSKVTLSQTVSAAGSAGDTFAFGLWAKHKNIAGKTKIKLQFIDHGVKTTTKLSLIPVDYPFVSYRHYEAYNILAPSAYDQITVNIQFNAKEGTLTIDEVSLTPVTALQTTSLIAFPVSPPLLPLPR